ncbi:RNA-dependent DNA polymerase [Pseudomonas nitroreducens]|uniref:RNA-dependent DNA polymerase n=1 Tax=Pseudomonas nitroreducens TaxID=46680 RepID=A0ABS0KK90_PSENT|nr:reverse transcriptase domain-containing protein [Pseudomonas nitroreducens]MBG6288493.1 RNA-dependent DNA polymerase [Pseudomonas nitroreducens]
MSSSAIFSKHFSEECLQEVYENSVVLSPATGIDNLTHKNFWPYLKKEIEISSRKALSGNYAFTRYKLKLISKGRGRSPREISIPTIRDRLVLKALCNFLFEIYSGVVKFELPQNMVKQAKDGIEAGCYNAFIKLDVENFYPSIRHDKLISRVRGKIRASNAISLISSALTTPTVANNYEGYLPAKIGIPQGLSISNVLAAIYLSKIDEKYGARSDIRYFRYVDDVFILCDYSDVSSISGEIIADFKKLGLKVHPAKESGGKSVYGRLGSGFDYLGYYFHGNRVSVREGSIRKIKESLISIFSSYKHSKGKSVGFLRWRLNLRVTGCVFKGKGKGWMFFFSEINDESLLHNLDRYVDSLIKRFGLTISPKSFVRTFFELRYSRYSTKYIPNFDAYNVPQMSSFLLEYFDQNTAGWVPERIKYEFEKKIAKQTKDLLEDIQAFGYS